MELRSLEYFVTVAEELHFGQAARRLHIVQPAVSQQVARLERELGLRLLDRSTRRVTLTPAGERVLAAARETLGAADRLRLVAAELGGCHTGGLRIGTSPGLTGRLERGVAALRRTNPQIEVTLVDHPVADRLAAVRRGDLDLALVRGLDAADDLQVLPAWTEPLYAVLPGGHPLAARATLNPADLAALTFRYPCRDLDPPLYDAVSAALGAAGVTARPGRSAGTVQNTLIEIGTGAPSWTLLPAEMLAAAGSSQVRGVPLDPPQTVTGSLVVPARCGSECARALVGAFA